MALGGALGCGLGARDAAPFCVAGVAQPYIHLRFTWQAWHKLASTLVSACEPSPWSREIQTAIEMSCFLPQKIASKKHTSLSHTPSFTRNFVTHIHIHTFIHTYVRTYIHIHTYVHAYYLFTYFHTQSFTTSFVFPSFPVPARTFEAHYWKKLTCGVIRSFNF